MFLSSEQCSGLCWPRRRVARSSARSHEVSPSAHDTRAAAGAAGTARGPFITARPWRADNAGSGPYPRPRGCRYKGSAVNTCTVMGSPTASSRPPTPSLTDGPSHPSKLWSWAMSILLCPVCPAARARLGLLWPCLLPPRWGERNTYCVRGSSHSLLDLHARRCSVLAHFAGGETEV